MSNHIYIYAVNEREIYNKIVNLAEKYEKREVNPVLWKEIKDSIEMQQIINEAKKICKKYGEPYPLRDQEEAKDFLSRKICFDFIQYKQNQLKKENYK